MQSIWMTTWIGCLFLLFFFTSKSRFEKTLHVLFSVFVGVMGELVGPLLFRSGLLANISSGTIILVAYLMGVLLIRIACHLGEQPRGR